MFVVAMVTPAPASAQVSLQKWTEVPIRAERVRRSLVGHKDRKKRGQQVGEESVGLIGDRPGGEWMNRQIFCDATGIFAHIQP